MATQTLKLNVKTGELDGKNFWERCGVVHVNTDDNGNITSLTVKHNKLPNDEMVAFAKANADLEPPEKDGGGQRKLTAIEQGILDNWD